MKGHDQDVATLYVRYEQLDQQRARLSKKDKRYRQITAEMESLEEQIETREVSQRKFTGFNPVQPKTPFGLALKAAVGRA